MTEPTSSSFANLCFDHSYTRLPSHFYEHIAPTPVKNPSLIALNETLAKEMGLNIEELKTQQGMAFFAGNFIPPTAKPIALAYAGHQFGHFVPQLGDGRAILLGEILNPAGQRLDIQLKGSGQTSFSRRGDGRAALGPVIREYIVSEAMHALGIKTTRSLACVTTDEHVLRECVLPGAIITRIASSHIRVGTFEYFAARHDLEALKTLCDYTIRRHYPECLDETNSYVALLKYVRDTQAKLIASWMHVGFIHGVMNTDNTSIAGETIDYGPCAFIDEYNPHQVFSSIDHQGRYAYSNQPLIAQWNLGCFAQTLLPLLDQTIDKAIDIAEEIIVSFLPLYHQYWLTGMRRKIGLTSEHAEDQVLIEELLGLMHQTNADFTNTFRSLCDTHPLDNTIDPEILKPWKERWTTRLRKEQTSPKEQHALMQSANPVFIPRNHRIEQTIRAAIKDNDFSLMKEMQDVLATPYSYKPHFAHYTNPPTAEERVKATFCGT